MKRLEEMGTVITTDVLVLGAGGAGACAALKAAQPGVDVLLLDKGGVGYCGQVPIGGGILAYVYPDYADQWVEKVTKQSFYFNNQEWTELYSKSFHPVTMELAEAGLTFHKENGKMKILDWGPHVHVTLFDAPKSLMALKRAARQRGVTMMDKINIVDLLTRDGKVVGAVGLGLVDGKTYLLNAKAVIIAMGNCGYLHEKTYASCLGDGAAAGYRAGAELVNTEFSSSYVWGTKILGKELFGIHFYLYLENARGEKIMGKHYPDLMEHIQPVYTFDPRVIDAMQKEVQAGYGPIYLNLRGLSDEQIADCAEDVVEDLSHLMANDNMLLLRDKAGIEPKEELLEMGPKLLYSGGGMRTDTTGRTNLEGLWAAGAASSNGWSCGGGGQGGLGVASAAITGFVAGENAAKYAAEAELTGLDAANVEKVLQRALAPMGRKGDTDASKVTYRVHDAVVPMKYTRQREAGRMKEALGIVREAQEMLPRVGVKNYHDLARYNQAESMALAAQCTFNAALRREESRAGHFREDFPQRDDANWFKWITIRKADGAPKLGTMRVPIETYRLQPEA